MLQVDDHYLYCVCEESENPIRKSSVLKIGENDGEEADEAILGSGVRMFDLR